MTPNLSTLVENMKALRCHSCNYKTHIRCDGITASEYTKIKKSIEEKKEPYLCKICRDEVFPFNKLTDEQYLALERGIECSDSLNILPNQRLKSLIKHLNAASNDD